MAQTSTLKTQPPEIIAISLSRVLSRLEQIILISPSRRLLRSSFERTKTSANLEYARTLLLRLEQDSSNLKIKSQKQSRQKTLREQRALIKRLTDRLHELENQDSDAYSSESEGEDLFADDSEAQPSPTTSTIPPSPSPQTSISTKTATTISPHLRNRHHPQSPISPISPMTNVVPSASASASTSIPEQLDSQSDIQSRLTASLITLSSQLKSQAQSFQSHLALDNDAISRAQQGLDKSEEGMAAAGKRMGLLKRMSEGKGWWGRVLLYAWIGGLWVVALGVVFVGPKLRF